MGLFNLGLAKNTKQKRENTTDIPLAGTTLVYICYRKDGFRDDIW